jgi:NADH:ubiquinone oxidoreductase subunit 4 (subunit M)
VLGALYMLWFAQRFLFGAVKAPHLPLIDLNLREKAILASIVVAVFALGFFPYILMRKTVLAARQYQRFLSTYRTLVRMASRPITTPPTPLDPLPVASAATSIESAR